MYGENIVWQVNVGMRTGTIALIGLIALLQARADDMPLGHPDFYPSHDRPIGWRGDSTGAWPGADCVGTWNAETGENIVWTLDTPGAGFSQPLVVGEKVFVCCDPNVLVCVNIHTGTILWQRTIDHTLAMAPEVAEKARAEIAFFHDLWMRHGRWASECEIFYSRLMDGGLAFKDIWNEGRFSTATLKEPIPEGVLADVLKDEGTRREWERLYSEQQANSFMYTTDDHTQGFGGEKGDVQQRLVAANQKYDIWFECEWEGWCGWSFATPCTDGEALYVTTVNNAVAAVNVADGNVRWLVWEHLGDANGIRKTNIHKGVSTLYSTSPVLYGNYLLVNQAQHTRVYDKRTGEKLWEYINPYPARTEAGKPEGHRWLTVASKRLDWTAILKEFTARADQRFDYRLTSGEACSPLILDVPLADGGILPVAFDGLHFLYRLEDGKVLAADVPFAVNCSAVRDRNVLMHSWDANTTYVVRLKAKDRDTLEYEWLYYASADPDPAITPPGTGDLAFKGRHSFCHDGWWYPGFYIRSREYGDGAFRISMEDGRLERFDGHSAGSSFPILAGDRVYFIAGGRLYSGPWRPRLDVDGVASASVYDLVGGRRANIEKAFIDRRLLEESDYAVRNRFVKAGHQMSNAAPSAQANRLFHRTKGVLYCVGDPGEPFPVPKNCPEQGRVPPPSYAASVMRVKAIDRIEALYPYLDDAHAVVRAAAARRLSAIGNPSPTEEAVALLRRLATEDLSARVRVEAMAAMGLGEGGAGRECLRELLQSVTSPWSGMAPRIGDILRALGDLAEPALVEFLESEDPVVQKAVAASIYYRDIGPSTRLRDALLQRFATSDEDVFVLALTRWSPDPAVKAAFTEAISDPKRYRLHPRLFDYLLPLQGAGERREFLKGVMTTSQAARRRAVSAMAADGALEEVRSFMQTAEGRTPADVAAGLVDACADSRNDELRRGAAEIIGDHLVQDDLYCLAGMLDCLAKFGALAAPYLTAVREIAPGADKRLAEARARALNAISPPGQE